MEWRYEKLVKTLNCHTPPRQTSDDDNSIKFRKISLKKTCIYLDNHRLLSIKLMPRIRDINSLIMFKPDRRQAYEHIDAILSDGIDYDLIRNHYREKLRIIISIKLGKVTASTIIRRLGSEGVRNSLFFAFGELGRVVKTQYLLEYIQDIETRETVNAATCKSEEFNNFLQWIFFDNSGII